jgi:hypothetical protein
MFLDTAAKRSSVVSHAKSLGYIPRNPKSAKSRLRIIVTSMDGDGTIPQNMILPRGSKFTTTINNKEFTFCSIADVAAPKITAPNGSYSFTFDVDIYEGNYYTYDFFVKSADNFIKYRIPNKNVDIETLNVSVGNDPNNYAYAQWLPASNALDVDSNSEIFFHQEVDEDYTEIFFGNDVVGVKPNIGSIIRIRYVSTNGVTGNGAKVFTSSGNLILSSEMTEYSNQYTRRTATAFNVSTLSKSQGGANEESLEEIRFNASGFFSSQDRIVTKNDYYSFVNRNFSNIKSLRVWGGEDNDPPQFGRIFLCIQPQTGLFLSNSEKNNLKELISSKSLINIKTEIVDPTFTYVKINTVISYKKHLLPSSVDLKSTVTNVISQYSDSTLEKFTGELRYSDFIKEIDLAHQSIISNQTVLSIYKEIIPQLGKFLSYSLDFNNELNITDKSIMSSNFKISTYSHTVFFTNFGKEIWLCTYSNNTIVKISPIGSVDNVTGKIYLSSINIIQISDTSLIVNVNTKISDIFSKNTNVLKIKPSDITVKLKIVE